MKLFFATIGLCLALSLPSIAHELDVLTLITEEYPPFNYTEDDLRQGIATDLLVEMFAVNGSLKSHADIASLPWARGYQIAKSAKNILLYSMTRTPERENDFQWVGPIIESEIALIGKKSANIHLDNIEQLKQSDLRIGVVLEDIGHQLLKSRGIDDKQIYPLSRGEQLVRMLIEGRVDLIAYGKLVACWTLNNLGENTDEYTPVYCLKRAPYYYALSLDVDEQLVKQLQAALDRLKNDQRIEKLTQEYLTKCPCEHPDP